MKIARASVKREAEETGAVSRGRSHMKFTLAAAVFYVCLIGICSAGRAGR